MNDPQQQPDKQNPPFSPPPSVSNQQTPSNQPSPTSQTNSGGGLVTKGAQQSGTQAPAPSKPYEYKATTSVNDNVNQLTKSDSLYMQQARQSGKNAAASRGLINSSIAAGASEQAAIQAATPIAQSDASSEMQKWNTEKSVQANLQGQYTDSVNEVMNNYAININEIETAEDLTQEEKDKMIKNNLERRDADLAFLKQMYPAMPTWSNNWSSFPVMPDAPGVELPDNEA